MKSGSLDTMLAIGNIWVKNALLPKQIRNKERIININLQFCERILILTRIINKMRTKLFKFNILQSVNILLIFSGFVTFCTGRC